MPTSNNTSGAPSRVARDVAEFHAMIGAPPWHGPIADMPAESIEVRNRLIAEEVRELVDATVAGDLVGIADALADIVYVAYGTAYTYGIDLNAVLAEVHRSNMTKEPGPTGKAVKGKRYEPPNIATALSFAAPPSNLPCPEGFHWIGQPFTTCDECGLPAWEHEGMADLPLNAGPFNADWVLRPWQPGEREACRAKWDPALRGQPAEVAR